MRYFKKITAVVLTFLTVFGLFSLNTQYANAATYSSVNLSVPYFRQRASGMCSFCAFSMAEAYATGYGRESEIVYQAIRTAHAPASSDSGYKADPTASPALIDGKRYKTISTSLETIYSYLQKGQPVVIWRSGSKKHWAVIYGYNGSASKLSQTGFLVINGVLTNNLNYTKKETLADFLSASSDSKLAHAVVRGTGVLAHKDNKSYSQNMNSYFANCSVSGITSENATIKGIFTNKTSISSAGFYIGTSSDNLKKVSKSLEGKTDGSGSFRSISYSMNKWFGKLSPATKYYYQLYYIKDGKEYKSPVNWFVTTGSAAVDSISISAMPTSYSVSGTNVILKGLELNVRYTDGTVKTVTDGYECKVIALSSDAVTVKITYKTASIQQTIKLSDISGSNTATNEKPSASSLAGKYSTDKNSYFNEIKVTDITETDAKIFGGFTLQQIDSAGFYIGTSPDNLKKVTKSLKGDVDGAGKFSSIFYLMSKWYGNLKPGTKYYYKVFYVKNGKECASPVNWFVTKGNTSITSIAVAGTSGVDVSYSIFSGLKISGLKLKVNYSDGTSKEISDGYTYKLTELGSNSATVVFTYSGVSVTEALSYRPSVSPNEDEPLPSPAPDEEEALPAPLPDETDDTAITLGDINGDKAITAADARFALRASVSLEKLTSAQLIDADLDKNGKITASDARSILRISVSLEDIEDYI